MDAHTQSAIGSQSIEYVQYSCKGQIVIMSCRVKAFNLKCFLMYGLCTVANASPQDIHHLDHRAQISVIHILASLLSGYLLGLRIITTVAFVFEKIGGKNHNGRNR